MRNNNTLSLLAGALFLGLPAMLSAQVIPIPPSLLGNANNFYQVSGDMTWGEGANNHATVVKSFPVPSGKIFVIEFVSVKCVVGSHETCEARLWTAINGHETSEHLLSLELFSSDTEIRTYRVSQMVKAYAGKDHRINITRPYSSGAPGGQLHYSLSGYLVDGN